VSYIMLYAVYAVYAVYAIYNIYNTYLTYKRGFLRSTVVYLKDLSPYRR